MVTSEREEKGDRENTDDVTRSAENQQGVAEFVGQVHRVRSRSHCSEREGA